jgi:hypothetical protein
MARRSSGAPWTRLTGQSILAVSGFGRRITRATAASPAPPRLWHHCHRHAGRQRRGCRGPEGDPAVHEPPFPAAASQWRATRAARSRAHRRPRLREDVTDGWSTRYLDAIAGAGACLVPAAAP